MKLLLKQRLFSWFDSYDIFDENGNTVFVVKGKWGLGHKLFIYDAKKNLLGKVQEKLVSFVPSFRMYMGNMLVGEIRKSFFSPFRPKFSLGCNGWTVTGDIFDWNYKVMDRKKEVMSFSRSFWHMTDTFTMDIKNPSDALLCVMIVTAIDAARCSEDKKNPGNRKGRIDLDYGHKVHSSYNCRK